MSPTKPLPADVVGIWATVFVFTHAHTLVLLSDKLIVTSAVCCYRVMLSFRTLDFFFFTEWENTVLSLY